MSQLERKQKIESEKEIKRALKKAPLPAEVSPHTRKRKGAFAEFWHRFKKNRLAVAGVIVVALYILMAFLADVLYPYDFVTGNQISNTFAKVGETRTIEWDGKESQYLYPFGADNFGRDILGRIVHGARVSMIIGFTTVAFAVVVGGALGAIAGYYGGALETLIMRGADILLAIPNILFALAIVAALGPSFRNLLFAIGVTSIPVYIRLVRASVLTVKDQEYIEAARALGARDLRIILLHIIPNCMAPVIVQATLGVAQAILSATSLSFLGLGIQPPSPEWGNMLSEARSYIISAPHTLIFPGLAIMTVILAYNMIGDGLRDALDPKLKR